LNQDTTRQYIELIKTINKLGIRQTIVYHSVPGMPNAFFQHYFDESTPFFDKIVAHTNEQLFALSNIYKLPQDKLLHINHGTKLCPFYDKQEARTKLNIPDEFDPSQNKKIVLSMGFFGGLKGVDELIDIHADLIQSNPDIIFVFAGGLHFATAQYGKEYMKRCFSSIISKGLKGKFIITGFIHENQLPFYYAASDLAVLNYKPSGYLSASGCSAKLVGSKRLIITTDATHRNDEIRNGIECLKAHYTDLDGLKNLIKNQLNNPNDTIINNAYTYAQENQWKNVADRYMKEVFV